MLGLHLSIAFPDCYAVFILCFYQHYYALLTCLTKSGEEEGKADRKSNSQVLEILSSLANRNTYGN